MSGREKREERRFGPSQPKKTGPTQKTKQKREERKTIIVSGAPSTPKPKDTTKTGAVSSPADAIAQAKTTIEQAEVLSSSFGSTITWGDKTYDLGTTQGWKDYNQAIREAKSKVNEAENELKKYETSITVAETTGKANTVIEAANNIIEMSNAIIAQSNETRKKLYEARVKLIEQDLKLTHGFTKKSQGEYYGDQLNETLIQLTDQINNDIKDPKQAKDTLKQIAPTYFTTVKKEDQIEKLFEEIEKRKRDAESRAEWDQVTGYYSGKRPTPAQLSARLEHLALASSDAFIKSLPIAALAVAGGPLAAGLIAGASVASFVDPKTRYETAVFIGAHPEEFYASMAGSLAAGMSVAKAKQMWSQYSTQVNNQALQNKMDKLIDDYTYLEQQKGAEFPSRLTQAPGDEPYVMTRGPGEDAWTDFVFRKFMEGLSKDDMAKWLKEQKPLLMLDLENTGKLKPIPIDELITKYPELKDPFIHPAFQDPSLLNKADLVARISGSKVQMTPLLAAALARFSQQGYLTDADIKELIKLNKAQIEIFKEFDLITPWSAEDFKEIDLTEIINLVSQIPEDITEVTPIQATIQETVQIAELIQELEQVEEPVPIVIPIPEPGIPTEPVKAPTPPFLPKSKPEERRDINLRLWSGPKEKYKVKVTFPGGTSQTLTVEARSFPEAVNKAQMSRRGNRYLPSVVDVTRVK